MTSYLNGRRVRACCDDRFDRDELGLDPEEDQDEEDEEDEEEEEE